MFLSSPRAKPVAVGEKEKTGLTIEVAKHMLSYDQSVHAFGYFIVCQENTAFGYALF